MTKTDWPELHRLNRLWRAWMDRNSKFVTPDELPTLQYASTETREAKREQRVLEAELIAQYLVDVAPPGTKRLLDAADDHAHKALDLWLRAQLPQHARNNARSQTTIQELAQVAMLILTALPAIDFEGAERDCFQVNELLTPIDAICILANGAVIEYASGFNNHWETSAHALLMSIDAWPGFNADTELRLCWSALAWKHASQHMHEYPEELAPVRDEVLIGPANAEVRVAFARAEVQP